MSAKALRSAPYIALALSVAGCATAPASGSLRLEEFPRIDVGTTTMAEVRSRLGTPQGSGKMPFKDRVWWEYQVTDAMQVDHLYSIYFSPDGVARETGMVRHPKYDTPGGYQ